jgi:hypothetical protein
MKVRERLTVRLGFRRVHRRCGQVVDLRQALVASWRRRVHDGDQGDTVSSKTWSASSITSGGEGEEWPEGSGRRWASGEVLIRRFAVNQEERETSGDAPGDGEDMGTENRRQGYLGSPESSGHARRCYGIRRAISSSWGCFGWERKGARERGLRAFYRRSQGEETGMHWSRGENLAGDGFQWKGNGWRLMVELTSGSRCRWERASRGYRFGFGFLGHGPDLELGRFRSPGPFNVFFLLSSFFFFCFSFLISFITFAFVTQMTSNQFLNFCKIHHYSLKQ